MQTDPSPLSWVLDHLQLIGWPTLVYLAWTVRGVFSGLKDRVENAEKLLDEMASNHMTHMEASLRSIEASMNRQEDRWQQWLTVKAAQNRDE